MYLDKPMRGHGLMQAIARVNRVFRDKPGGLAVDYLGLAHQLKEALATYTESGGEGRPQLDKTTAVQALMEQVEICRGLFHGFDASRWSSGDPASRLSLLPAAQQHIFEQEDGPRRLTGAVRELSRFFALAVPHDDARTVSDEVGFFQAVRSVMAKTAAVGHDRTVDTDHAIRQIVSKAIAPDEVIDIFAAAGLKSPDISILSEEFLDEVRKMQHPNLAVELLGGLLKEEVKKRKRRNLVQSRSFSEMLGERSAATATVRSRRRRSSKS